MLRNQVDCNTVNKIRGEKKLKICTRCKQNKEEKEYFLVKSGKGRIPSRVCIFCHREKAKDYYFSLPKEIRKLKLRNWQHTPFGLYRIYFDNAKRRNILFRLGVGMFNNCLEKKCFYCGKPPEKDKPNGLDRIDNNKGYVIGNVIVACSDCNRMKLKLTKEEFINQCKKIADYQNKKEE